MPQRGNGHYSGYIESSLLYSRIRRGFYPRAVPSESGAARPGGGHQPAGTRGDIQAVALVNSVCHSCIPGPAAAGRRLRRRNLTQPERTEFAAGQSLEYNGGLVTSAGADHDHAGATSLSSPGRVDHPHDCRGAGPSAAIAASIPAGASVTVRHDVRLGHFPQ